MIAYGNSEIFSKSNHGVAALFFFFFFFELTNEYSDSAGRY